MKIVAIPDLHGSTKGINNIAGELSAADVVLLAGDLTNFGNEMEAARIVEEFRQHADIIYAVPGNCDYPGVNKYLIGQEIGLHGKGVVIDGVALIGVGGSLPAPGGTPTEYSEIELQEFMERAMADVPADLPLVLMAHQPPVDTKIDRLPNGMHVGSKAVRKFIEKHRPLICFSGHIHEGVGIDTIEKTKLINPGPFRNGGYAYAEIERTIGILEIRNL
jgi:Icc-related predicted phosphoesterase